MNARRSARPTRFVHLFALACGLASCATREPVRSVSSPLPALASPSPSVETPDVTIRFVHASKAHWRAEYVLKSPVQALVFRRQNYEFRTRWQFTSPTTNVRLVQNGRLDAVVGDAPFTAFSVDIPVTDEQSEQNYKAFYSYTDRGLLAYTGHIAVGLARCGDSRCTEATSLERGAKLDGRITIVGAPLENILVRGQKRAHEVTLRMADNGTYAYAGDLTPTETSDYVGVFDHAFPTWLRTRLEDFVPRLFARYGDLLGRPKRAEERPTFFASYGTRAEGRSVGGNVMPPRVINFHVGLTAARASQPSSEIVDQVQEILAHEVAHLWNGDLFVPQEGAATSWMHEGAADALAWRVLLDLHAIDEKAYRERASNALSLCVLSLSSGASLADSARSGNFRDYYTCGATIALLTEASVKKQDPEATLVSFWKTVFAGANEDGEYDTALYFRTLDSLSGSDRASAFVRTMTTGVLSDPARDLRGALESSGIRTHTPISPPPLEYQARVAPHAVRALFSDACAKALVFDGNRAVYPRIAKNDACGVTKKGDVLTAFEGIDLAHRGSDAFDAGLAACRKIGAIHATLKGGEVVRLACQASPRARTPYVELIVP